MNRYTCYGIVIGAEMKLPGLTISDCEPDAYYVYESVPGTLGHPVTRGVCFEAARDAFLLHIPRLARILVSSGERVSIELLNKDAENEIGAYLTGTVLAVLLQQRGYLVFHGSVALGPQGAVAFMGSSGTGKSTLVAALAHRGYPLMADDICVVRWNSYEGMPCVFPASSTVKLWADAAKTLGYTTHEGLRVRNGIEKFRVAHDTLFHPVPAVLHSVVALHVYNQSAFNCSEVKGAGKFNLLNNHIFRYRFIEGMGLKKKYFDECTALARNITVYSFYRPRNQMGIEATAEQIIPLIRKPA